MHSRFLGAPFLLSQMNSLTSHRRFTSRHGIFTYERPLTLSYHHLTVLQPQELCRERTENPVRPWRTSEITLEDEWNIAIQYRKSANCLSPDWMMSGCMLTHAWDRMVTLSVFMWEQDWPVASELVPGGIHFPFCFYNAHYMIIRTDKWSHGRIGKELRVVGFRNNWVEIK